MSYKNTGEYTLIDNVAADLIDRNGVTSTKEIKNELRSLYPGAWYQSTVSEIMKELSDVDGKYEYFDNGEYREYRMPTIVQQLGTGQTTTIDDIIDSDIPVITLTPPKGSILNRLRTSFLKK